MIKSIYIKNFKSIFEDTITLSALTILIGANGSGKSNLVKALEFLSTIPTSGIATAVNAYGGFSGIVPKAVAAKELKKKRIAFTYRLLLPPPDEHPNDFPPIAVEHEFELGYSPQEVARVIRDKLIFNEILVIAEVLRGRSPSDKIDWHKIPSRSKFVLQRGARGGLYFSGDPPISKRTMHPYLEWLGIPFLEKQIQSKKSLRDIILQITTGGEVRREPSQRKSQRHHSFLDPDIDTIVDYAQQFKLFRDLVGSIRRYDLLLNELRTDQQVSDSRQLSSAGRNMPSVLRHLRFDPGNEAAWNRIVTTLGTIAPHIGAMTAKPLRTGKEFVEFVESAMGRGVESWESSDGTLRALSILLALETHRPYSTILIEEPEQNLHPWAIRTIIDHIREVVHERHLQVIVTTHSQQVLQRVHPHEVLVATRTQNDGTKFRGLKELIPTGKIEMGEVGELWVRGLLGGVPSYE